jgi:hypothetical protein
MGTVYFSKESMESVDSTNSTRSILSTHSICFTPIIHGRDERLSRGHDAVELAGNDDASHPLSQGDEMDVCGVQ